MSSSFALLFPFVFFILIHFSLSDVNVVKLTWDEHPDPSVNGFKLYYSEGFKGPPFNGTSCAEGPSPITFPMASLGDPSHPLIEVHNFTAGLVCFALTAYNDAGESGYSNPACSLLNDTSIRGNTNNPEPIHLGHPLLPLAIGLSAGLIVLIVFGVIVAIFIVICCAFAGGTGVAAATSQEARENIKMTVARLSAPKDSQRIPDLPETSISEGQDAV